MVNFSAISFHTWAQKNYFTPSLTKMYFSVTSCGMKSKYTLKSTDVLYCIICWILLEISSVFRYKLIFYVCKDFWWILTMTTVNLYKYKRNIKPKNINFIFHPAFDEIEKTTPPFWIELCAWQVSIKFRDKCSGSRRFPFFSFIVDQV